MDNLSNNSVLVVDDTDLHIEILACALGNEYNIISASDGKSALELIANNPPDLVLLDIMMPGVDGYEVCRLLKSDPETRDIPIIFLSAMTSLQDKTKGFELGAVDYITKPFEIREVRARVKTHLTNKLAKKILESQKNFLEEKIRERTLELSLTQEVTIECMASLAETRDPETGGHIKRTKEYVRELARNLQNHPRFSSYLNDNTIDLLYKSAPLHDIGKVGVPDSILLKPAELTPDEWVEMKKHTLYGRNALRVAENQLGKDSFLRYAREIAYSHHEKWDGSGYPEGLSGDEIPICGRLMAVADVYDTLISKRVYKVPFPHTKAVNIIENDKGKSFDPHLVDVFLDLADKFRNIAMAFVDSEEQREMLSIK
jgi:putative two-component system response regulator